MGIFGGGIGAAAGALALGPLGAVAGGALGSLIEDWLGDESGDDVVDLPMELDLYEEPDGLRLIITPGFDASEVDGYSLYVLHRDGGFVGGRGFYNDEDGDFLLTTRPLFTDGGAAFFIPDGAIKIPAATSVTLKIATVVGEAVGYSTFTDVGWPAQTSFNPVVRAHPLINLAHAVVTSDGSDISRSAADDVFNALEYSSSTRRQFDAAWSSATLESTPKEVFEAQVRFPWLEGDDVVGWLAELIKLRDRHSPKGVALIREIALELGLDETAWPDLAEELGLVDTLADQLLAAFEVLGLSEGASLLEARTAYRALMRDYHPDAVAGLPKGYQEYATERSQEINGAYELVLRHLKEGEGM